MAFNENAVNRDNGGRFDHKLGSPAEVSLPPVVYGGRFGAAFTPVEPLDEDYVEARKSLGIAPDVELVGDQPRHVQGQAESLARFHEPQRAFEEGRPHYLDENLDAIWNGEGGGYSEAMFQKHLDRTQDLRRRYESGEVGPSGVVGPYFRGDGPAEAAAYLDEQETMYSEALRTHGRSFALNVENARNDYHRSRS